jgi:hypothetical protein
MDGRRGCRHARLRVEVRHADAAGEGRRACCGYAPVLALGDSGAEQRLDGEAEVDAEALVEQGGSG